MEPVEPESVVGNELGSICRVKALHFILSTALGIVSMFDKPVGPSSGCPRRGLGLGSVDESSCTDLALTLLSQKISLSSLNINNLNPG